MRLTAEYLEQARHFECIAREEEDLQLRSDLKKQADVFRKLAATRAKKLGIALDPRAAHMREVA